MEVPTENVENALDVIFKVDKELSKKNSLLGKDKIVYLQIVLFKIPYAAPRKRKFLKLCHSLYGDDPEICLFVPNRKTGVEYKVTTDELIDYCVDYYTEFLEKHKIKGIKTVMPLKQLRAEYGTYDLRRKLVHRFDLFLCKNSLLYNSRFLTSLGKIFRVANKEPLGVHFPHKNIDFDPEFQKNIDKAIHTSSFFITRFSDNYSIPFGRLSHSKAELRDNLLEVLKQILNENIIPGGFNNIRAMHVWPSQSKPIPLFVSPGIPVNMKTPRLKSAKRKLKGVEGELSSQPYKKVFVMPSGEVFVTKIRKKNFKKLPKIIESEDDDSFKDDSDFEDEKEVKIEHSKFKVNTNENDKSGSESENDEEIEEKEAKLMKLKIKSEGEFNTDGKLSEESENEDEEKRIKFSRKQSKEFSKNTINKNSNKADSKTKEKSKKILQKKKKINKARKKTEMKQQKSKLKEKLNQTRKKKVIKAQKS